MEIILRNPSTSWSRKKGTHILSGDVRRLWRSKSTMTQGEGNSQTAFLEEEGEKRNPKNDREWWRRFMWKIEELSLCHVPLKMSIAWHLLEWPDIYLDGECPWEICCGCWLGNSAQTQWLKEDGLSENVRNWREWRRSHLLVPLHTRRWFVHRVYMCILKMFRGSYRCILGPWKIEGLSSSLFGSWHQWGNKDLSEE